MAYERSKGARDNYVKFLHQFQPETKILIRKLEMFVNVRKQLLKFSLFLDIYFIDRKLMHLVGMFFIVIGTWHGLHSDWYLPLSNDVKIRNRWLLCNLDIIISSFLLYIPYTFLIFISLITYILYNCFNDSAILNAFIYVFKRNVYGIFKLISRLSFCCWICQSIPIYAYLTMFPAKGCLFSVS